MFATLSVGIYISGRSVHGQCQNAQVIFDENNVHNEIRIDFTDPNLYTICNPAIEYGTERIKVVINSRTLWFLLETREGDENSFTISGRGKSAYEDAPFASDMDFQLDTPTKASVLAASLLESVTLDWQTTDWVVPTEFEFSGNPLDGVTMLAREVGAIVRAKDDGSLVVRNKFSVSPKKVDTVLASVNYDRSYLLSLSHSTEREAGYNAITVYGKPEESASGDNYGVPELRLEETTPSPPLVGQEVVVRIYWGRVETDKLSAIQVTHGEISDLGFETEENEEDIVFISGRASLSTAIDSLKSISWYGSAAKGTITYEQGGKELRILENVDSENEEQIANVYGIAKVKYSSTYQRIRCFKHEVVKLLFVLIMEAEERITTDVRTSEDAVYGEPIDAPLLTSEAATVNRAKSELAKAHRFSVLRIETPYDDLAIDGNLAYIDDYTIGDCGNYHIESAIIQINDTKLTNELAVKRCVIF